MIYYEDKDIKVYNSSCFNMVELEDNSIQCCVTSPPYWGLRKYKAPDLIFGGDKDCRHEWISEIKSLEYVQGNTEFARPHRENKSFTASTNTCSICGAWKGQFGLEPTPELYVAHTIDCLREIKRVLRKDGVCFWNIGDSYASTPGLSKVGSNLIGTTIAQDASKGLPKRAFSIKPKNLCLIPFRVAIAAQEDGWYIRSVIIWNKPNPMPESVQDRPTDAYEHILMMTKSPKYYWDIDAVREKTELWAADGFRHNNVYTNNKSFDNSNTDNETHPDREEMLSGRNLRNVWTFPTQPYPEAHFATYPEKLPETCIKAASKEGDLILDPFAGSGTTLWVAKKLRRKAVGYETSPEYCELNIKRNRQQVMV